MEQAMAQMRQEFRDSQIAIQQQQAVLTQQQIHVTDAAARSQTAEQKRADVGRMATRLTGRADDGRTIDNKALGQPFKYNGKKDSDLAE